MNGSKMLCMKVISVLNQKGGAGKTTIATHLARAFQLDGTKVLLIDSDPQGSARDWAAMKPDQPVSVVGIDRPTIERDLKSVAAVDFAIIDGAPQIHEMAVSAVKASHFVLIPVQPSPYDIWATSALVELIKARIEITEGKLAAAFVLSRVIKGTKIGEEVAAALSDYGLPVLRSRISQRVGFPASAARGSTILDEEPKSDGTREVLALRDELKSLLL